MLGTRDGHSVEQVYLTGVVALLRIDKLASRA
jgi:hypothetical protein